MFNLLEDAKNNRRYITKKILYHRKDIERYRCMFSKGRTAIIDFKC